MLLRRLLLKVCIFSAALLPVFLNPQRISAQAIGTHLGEGDVNFQISIINMLKSKGAGAGFPVTVLLNINTSVQEDATNLANAVKSAGFIPIVRLTHVCDGMDGGLEPEDAVNAVKSKFGADTLVVFGNEINNPNECGNLSLYVQRYNKVAGIAGVSPAALDYYNGNFPPAKWFVDNASTGVGAIYQTAKPRAANAYGCTFGFTAETCDPASTDTHLIGYRELGGPIYLTEFSLSPEGRKADAPDTDLVKVVAFIQSRSAETGAVLITPLIRNVCNSEGEWLLYVNGKVFTNQGTDVTDNCEGKSGFGYDTSIYPGYDAQNDWFYLHPIRGILPAPEGSVPDRKVSIIREDLAGQGYQTYCAAPDATIKLSVNTADTMNKFIDLYGGILLQTSSVYKQNTESVSTPIYRDVQDKRFLMSSLEEYWGFSDLWVDDGPKAELNSAPINSLLSVTQRCVQAVETLTSAELMCERLRDWDKCALFSREIPEANMNVKQLLQEIGKVMNYREGGISAGCKALFGESTTNQVTAGQTKLQRAILNTPIHLDRSYRLAFLVTTIEYKPFAPPKLFNFFTDSNKEADPRHEVLVTAFKIPDILTNKGGGETSGHQYFNDPAILTRNLLVPEEKRTKEYEPVANELRKQVAQNAKAASQPKPGAAIHCLSGGSADVDFVNGSGSPACRDELGKSIVDIINGNTPSCSDFDDEPVNQINDLGAILYDGGDLEKAGLLFRPGYGFGEQLFAKLFQHLDGVTKLNPHLAETPEIKSIYEIRKGWDLGDSVQAKFYLVYPIGYELDEVTNVLKHTFLTDEQIATQEQSDPPKDRFELSGAAMDFVGGKVGHSFRDTSQPCTIIGYDPITRLPITSCPEEEFSLDLRMDGDGQAGIVGAKLGYWMRKVQQAFTPLFTKSHAYLKSCKTTEEFLLGNCGGGPIAVQSGNGGSSSGTGSSTASCGKNYPIKAENLQPPYEAVTPLDDSVVQVPPNPRRGKAMFYGGGLMDKVLLNRKAWNQIPQDKITSCENGDARYKGCVALLRSGDIGRDIWMQRGNGPIEGPFLVIDVAAQHDVACLLERNWVVDVDYATAKRWNMSGPIDIVLHTNPTGN